MSIPFERMREMISKQQARGDTSLTAHADSAIHAMAQEPQRDDPQAQARWEEALALAGRSDEEAIDALLAFLHDEHPIVRWQAGAALANTAQRLRRRPRWNRTTWAADRQDVTFATLTTRLARELESQDSQYRVAIVDSLAHWQHEAIVPLLITTIQVDQAATVRAGAATALGATKSPAAIESLIAALTDRSLWVQRAAASALGTIGAPGAAAALRDAMASAHPLLQASIVCALGHISHPISRQVLAEATTHPDVAIRWYAARGLAQVGAVNSLPVLEELRADENTAFDQPISEMAAAAIESIEKRELGFWNWLCKQFYIIRRRLERKG